MSFERVRAIEDGKYASNVCKAVTQKSIFLLTIHLASLLRLLHSDKWQFAPINYDDLSKYYMQKLFSLTTASGEIKRAKNLPQFVILYVG